MIFTEEPLKHEEDLINELYLEVEKLGRQEQFWDAVGSTLGWKPKVRGWVDVECMNSIEMHELVYHMKKIVSGDYNDKVIHL